VLKKAQLSAEMQSNTNKRVFGRISADTCEQKELSTLKIDKVQ
jgi:hypothetical protein